MVGNFLNNVTSNGYSSQGNLHADIRNNNLGLGGDQRPQLTRVRSFMYRNYQNLRQSAARALVNYLVVEIFFIALLFVLLVSIKDQQVTSEYSRNEKSWAVA